ncbi:peptidoglycan editing factor PgeF [Streptomyces sp. P38-E01]|uniref:Purine nucleoside phosphorylase n=1 Tax=Streptomyces tardus TaxID=2780544 RepID=A0A949JHI2_9ACTN|nr:peptidoglycan editing factor PgeF [Streptomyces tardus]MBU7599562.1 peptidoglycan editing factor PgeF [Streptomyces tardus]
MIPIHTAVCGAHFAFTDRWGGVSAAPYGTLNLGGAVGDSPEDVAANRERAAVALGVAADRVVWMNQVHGNEVAVVEGAQPPRELPPVDGVVTATPGTVLAVLTADCTPVLLADPAAGVVAAAHAGRPGLLAGVVPATVARMVELGADPERITARLGPAVCGRCYEVPEQMREEAAGIAPASRATTSWGTPAIDVPAGVRGQLAESGVFDVTDPAVCTLESQDHFSYRRERTTGRLASYTWLEQRG